MVIQKAHKAIGQDILIRALSTRYNTQPNRIQYSRAKIGRLYVWRKTGCMEGAVEAVVPYFRACFSFYYFLFSFLFLGNNAYASPPPLFLHLSSTFACSSSSTYCSHSAWLVSNFASFKYSIDESKVQTYNHFRIVICFADSCILHRQRTTPQLESLRWGWRVAQHAPP